MDIRSKLSQRIGLNDINEILSVIRQNKRYKEDLYKLVFDEGDEITAYQAAWILTHFSPEENKWLYDKQNELIDEVLICKHGGKRRLILNLLNKQPLGDMPRVDFLDFCIERMVSRQELPGVQSLCMKIAYELCRSIPELTQELRVTLEMMEGDFTPAIQMTRKKVLEAIRKGKNLKM